MIKTLVQKGVMIPNPDSVFISDDVNPDRISGDNVILYAGTKLIGEKTLVMTNCRIGYESPVTLENTLVGENTHLKGGFFGNAVFAGNNVFGSGAHVRNGTILEEEANAGHTVGLKQTLLFPFVTLGSLINFCDCFMAGGTSRKNHSEVGSSFIHFNYTPNQDKATPSMMGDVPLGVMLRSRPIFLGGQGGLVGPVRITYGCMTAAGSIIRKNETRPDRLLLGGALKDYSLPRSPMVYKDVTHIYNNNIAYIAGLISLKFWYANVRPLFVTDALSKELVQGLQTNLDQQIRERISRFTDFCEKLEQSRDLVSGNSKSDENSLAAVHKKALDRYPSALEAFDAHLATTALSEEGNDFVRRLRKKIKGRFPRYIEVIQSLDNDDMACGTQWLTRIESDLIETLSI